MGAIKFRVLSDLRRLNAHLGIRCPSCDRYVVYEREGMIQWFQFKGWNPSLEVAGTHFRCESCGHRGAELSVVAHTPPAPPPAPVKLVEREAKAEVRRRRG